MNKFLVFSKFNTKYTFLLFLLFFGPVIVILGYRIDSRMLSIVTLFVIGLIYLYTKNKKIIVPYFKIQSIFLFSLLLLYAFLSFNVILLNDMYYFEFVNRMIFLYIVAIMITTFISDKEKFVMNYHNYIFYITFVNSIIIILMAHIEALRNLIQSLQYQTALLQVSGNIRMQTLNGMEGATLSTFIFFGGLSYFYMDKRDAKKSFFLLLIIYSLIYVGRTGLMFFMIFFIFKIFFYYIKKYKFTSILFIVIFSSILFIVFKIFIENLYLLPIEYQNTFRFLSSISKTETGLPFTIDLLLRTGFFLPEYNVHNIFIGTYGISSLADSGYFSDVGYVKMLFTIGYIGLFLYSLVYIVFLYFALKLKKYEKSFEYIVFVILFLFLFHFKANALTMTAIYFLILLSFNVSLLKLRLKKQENYADE